MKNPLPNPFLPKDIDEAFALKPDVFIEENSPGTAPEDDQAADDAPATTPTYPDEFEAYDLEELAGLTRPNRWRITPVLPSDTKLQTGRLLLARRKLPLTK